MPASEVIQVVRQNPQPPLSHDRFVAVPHAVAHEVLVDAHIEIGTVDVPLTTVREQPTEAPALMRGELVPRIEVQDHFDEVPKIVNDTASDALGPVLPAATGAMSVLDNDGTIGTALPQASWRDEVPKSVTVHVVKQKAQEASETAQAEPKVFTEERIALVPQVRTHDVAEQVSVSQVAAVERPLPKFETTLREKAVHEPCTQVKDFAREHEGSFPVEAAKERHAGAQQQAVQTASEW